MDSGLVDRAADVIVEMFVKRLRNFALAMAFLLMLVAIVAAFILQAGVLFSIMLTAFGAVGGYLSIFLMWIRSRDQLREQGFHW